MNWVPLMEFVRGPLFYFAILFFIAGMAYRLVNVLALGWKKDYVPAKHNKLGGSIIAFLKGVIVWPFIPRISQTATRNPIIYFAGGLFHLGLFVTVLLGAAHILVWKSLLGFGWPSLPLPIIDWLAAIAIISLIVLFINRISNPVLKLLTRVPDYFNLLFVFMPMVTGFFLTHRLFLSYEAMFTIHVLFVDLLLIWIPLSRISHFMFYFYSKARYGAAFAQRGARP